MQRANATTGGTTGGGTSATTGGTDGRPTDRPDHCGGTTTGGTTGGSTGDSRLPKTGAELNTVADYHERQGRWDEALAFAQRAVKADPTCWACFSSLGEILFEKQQYQDAVRAQTIALSLLPDGVAAPEEDQKLRKYIDAARKGTADAPAPE